MALPTTLQNYYQIFQKRTEKFAFLINFLVKHPNDKIIIFFNTCASVAYYHRILTSLSFLKGQEIKAIHGQMKQNKRNKIFQDFVSNQKGVLIATDVIARGIDLPDVNWILQFDPPQDPNFYIHRVGRTARAGREGNALLMLLDHEDTYIRYLELKNIQIEKMPHHFEQDIEEEAIRETIMELQLKDRDYIEKGKNAFVSFIRSYKEHELKYIFQFDKLKMGDTANSFFLYRIPRIKEILGKKIEDFTQTPINFDDIKFVDKNQEAQFLKKKEKSEHLRKEREELKKIKEKNHSNQNQKKSRSKSQRKRTQLEADLKDLEEFSLEEKLVKKLKKGQISLQEFKKRMKEIDGDDVDEEEIKYL